MLWSCTVSITVGAGGSRVPPNNYSGSPFLPVSLALSLPPSFSVSSFLFTLVVSMISMALMLVFTELVQAATLSDYTPQLLALDRYRPRHRVLLPDNLQQITTPLRFETWK